MAGGVVRGVARNTTAGDVAIAGRGVCPSDPSQRDPDAEEPEAPIVEIRVEEGLHPAAVVIERLVVEPALVDPTPAQIGRRWRWGSARIAEVRAARIVAPRRATLITIAARAATAIASAGSVVSTTWIAGGSAGPVVMLLRRSSRPARPARSSRSSRAARSLAVDALRSARGRTGLCGGEAGSGGQCGDTDADGDHGGTCHAFEMHGHLSFRGVRDALINPTAERYADNLCVSFLLLMSGLRDRCNWSDGRDVVIVRVDRSDTPDTR